MILRRVKAHVEKENWFAVFIDFCIVVIGVFVGIQVANWNASQFERREEAAIIERLRSDFVRVQADSDLSLAFHAKMTEDVRIVLRSLKSGVLEDDDVSPFERVLVLGTAFQTSADRAGSFTELMSSGRSNILRDRDLLHALVDYEDFLERFAVARNYYVENALLVTPAFRLPVEYDIDFQLTDDFFALVDQGEQYVDYDFEALSSDPAFYNAVEELLLIHSGFTMWRQRISNRIDTIQQSLAASKP